MIVVVGLAFEARIAARSGLQVICSGDGRNLERTLRQAISTGCKGLISFGVAGGLKAGLNPGACVVGSAIVSREGRLPTDRNWSQKLMHAMPGAIHGVLAGAPTAVATPADKRALNRGTGAIAVDTESHIVAHAAARHGLPMVALRVILDPVTRTLPELALTAVRPDGTTDIFSLLRSLARRPHALPGLLMTALDARAARATLLRGSRLLGPDLELAVSRDLETAALTGATPGLGPAVS